MKKFRPRSGAENLALSYPLNGEYVERKDWPYETDDEAEIAILDKHPLLTDRPEPKPKGDGKSPEKKGNS